jgi:hypothetical protein
MGDLFRNLEVWDGRVVDGRFDLSADGDSDGQ